MRLRITNPMFSKEKIQEVVRFVRPGGISRFTVAVRGTRYASASGRAYCGSWHPRVMFKVGSSLKFPYSMTSRGAYLGVTVYSLEETLVFIMAHELRHLWQLKHPRGYRVWGARGQYSERDADAYALHKLREWRRRVVIAEPVANGKDRSASSV